MKNRTSVIVFAIAILLQVTVVPYAGTLTLRPNLPLLVLIAFAVRRGAFASVIAGFIVGLAMDLLSTNMLGMSAFVFSLTGFVTGKIFLADVVLPFGQWLLACMTGVLIAALTWALLLSMGTLAPIGVVLFTQTLPSAAYTWTLGLLWGLSPWYRQRRRLHLD